MRKRRQNRKHPDEPAAIDTGDLFAALQDNFSPEAIAAMVSFLSTAVSTVGTNSPEVDSQIEWFTHELTDLLGGNQALNNLCEQIGL
ncbi:MAG: hypothetical protein JW936_03895 [Sedimentisphaerales bacterium]|nr:hypothetical protein [Sedimentisphaerales bacterium]